MKRFYSPDSYCASGACVKDLISQKYRSSHQVQSTISRATYQPKQTRKIGRYYYNENDQIGRGYTSKVYKAYLSNSSQNLSTQSQPFAIKVIPLSKATPSSMQLLQNEIQILKMLDHPNIIKCFDIYKSKSHCYIITQYCPGGCLMSFLAKNKPSGHKKILTQDKVINITQQIVQGIKYLQLKGILHRDIKPANILKGKNSWKIADFGFAIKSSTEVKSKFNVGTPLYMPLQSLTQNLYSAQSDIFSVGIILYELLTGTTPWQSKSEKQLIRKLEVIPLQKAPSKSLISPQIFKLILKMCALKKKFRMTKQEFNDLHIETTLRLQNLQNPQSSISDLKEDLPSVKSEILFERKLRQNKSMDHLQFLKEKENLQNKHKFQVARSIIFEKHDKESLPTVENTKKNSSYVPEKPLLTQGNEARQLKSYGSKKQIFSSIKDRYFDIPLSMKSTNFKKNPTNQAPKFLQRGSLRLQVKPLSKRQDNTRSTQTKESQVQVANQVQQENLDEETKIKYISEMTHIFLNQIHFCRFLFYLYKNALYILLCKKSQDRLAVIIFKLIFQNLEGLEKAHQNSKVERNIKICLNLNKMETYIKSEKGQMMKKTIKQYKQKYEKEFSGLKIKLGQKVFEEMQAEQMIQQQLMSRSSHTKQVLGSNVSFLKLALKQTKTLLKEYDHNLVLTIDSMGYRSYVSSPRYNRSSGYISANIQGLNNLYQLYRLIGILIESDNDLELFERKSKIKVNTDYSKNSQITASQLQKLRELIRLL